MFFKKPKKHLWDVNRIAVIVRPKQAFVDWLNRVETDKTRKWTLKDMGANVYLVDDDLADYENWQKLVTDLFSLEMERNEFHAWYTDPDMWPDVLEPEEFRRHFSVEVIDGGLFDLGQSALKREESDISIMMREGL